MVQLRFTYGSIEVHIGFNIQYRFIYGSIEVNIGFNRGILLSSCHRLPCQGREQAETFQHSGFNKPSG